MDQPRTDTQTPARPAAGAEAPAVSAHFVNNVLAAAASYIDEDPDQARDVLAELGQYLSYGLRPPATVTLAQELEHTATYLRLQQARFPGRIETRLAAGGTGVPLTSGAVQGPVAAALDERLRSVAGPCVVDLHSADGGLELELRGPQDLVGDTLAIPLSPTQEVAP